jgi:hypothetical protein
MRQLLDLKEKGFIMAMTSLGLQKASRLLSFMKQSGKSGSPENNPGHETVSLIAGRFLCVRRGFCPLSKTIP